MPKHLQGQAKTDGRNAEFGIMVQENLLPTPEDLAKFKEVDHSIVSWIMKYSDKEQDARIRAIDAEIKFDSDRILLTKSEHSIIKTSLWLAFFIAVFFIGLAALLIFLGQNIAGTIFGGIALILCVQAFLKFGRNQKQ